MCNKVPFTKKEAKAALKNAGHGRQYRKERRMYFCGYHNAWHLTSQIHTQSEKEIEPIEPERWQALLNQSESLP